MVNPRPGKRRLQGGDTSRARVAPTRRTADQYSDDEYTSRHRPWVRAVVWVVVIAMVLSGVSVLFGVMFS
jgi:hypothetical protein